MNRFRWQDQLFRSVLQNFLFDADKVFPSWTRDYKIRGLQIEQIFVVLFKLPMPELYHWEIADDPSEPCNTCGEEHQYPHPIVSETVYLPMDCPNCGRHRLEFDGYHVICEKCGSTDWKYPREKVNMLTKGK